MLYLIASDLDGNQVFGVGFERLWAVPLALGVTGFTDRHGRPS